MEVGDAGVDRVDVPVAVETSFVWDPWPEGPIAYRVELASCNDDAALPGRCGEGFDCTGSLDVELVALTRSERVCVARDAVTAIRVATFEPYAPSDPVEVPLVVTSNGEPFEGSGTLRLIDAQGAEAYSGPLVDGATLRLGRGELRALVSVPRDARNPEWTRGARVVVGEGAIAIPFEHGSAVLRGEGRAALRNLDTGVDLEVELPADVPLVAGTYEVTLVRAEGSAPQASLRVVPGEAVELELEARVVDAAGAVRIDGAPVMAGEVVFHDPETGHEVRTDVVAGRYGVTLLDRAWAVYLDMREVEGTLPQMRALTHEAVRPSDALDVEVSTVSLRGTYTVDGAPAPTFGERFGFLQVVDALGIAGAGVSVQDGAFEGRVYASRASLRFVGTHSTAPRLAQTVAEGVSIDDAPIEIDVQTAQLEIALRIDGATFPASSAVVPRGRGVVSIGDATRSLDALLPPRGEAIASIVVPPGRWTLRYVNEGFEALPIGQLELGEVEVVGETRVERDLALHEIFLSVPPDAGRVRFSGSDGSWAETAVSGGAPGTIRLFAGTWRAHELCTAGCGRLLLSWHAL